MAGMDLIESGQKYDILLRDESKIVLQSLMAVLPSEYRSAIPSTNYGLYLSTIAREIARIKIKLDKIRQDNNLTQVRPEFLWQFLGVYLFKGDVPNKAMSDDEFNAFLMSLFKLLLQGSKKESIGSGLELILSGSVQIRERYKNSTYDISDQFTFDSVELSNSQIDDTLKQVLTLIKPAHTIYKLTYLFEEEVDLQTEETITSNVQWYYYEDGRKFWEGIEGVHKLGGQKVHHKTDEPANIHGSTITPRGRILTNSAGTQLAQSADVIVTVNGDEVEVSDVYPTVPGIVLSDAPPINAEILVSYYWVQYTNIPFARLNDPNFVLNSLNGSGYPNHLIDVTDTEEDFGVVHTGSVEEPEEVYHAYHMVCKENSAVLNDPTSLLLNMRSKEDPSSLWDAPEHSVIQYEGDALPSSPWTDGGSGGLITVGNGALTLTSTPLSNRYWSAPLPDQDFSTSVVFRIKLTNVASNGAFSGFSVIVTNGIKAAVCNIRELPALLTTGDELSEGSWTHNGLEVDTSTFHTYRLSWDYEESVSLYVDEMLAATLLWSGLPKVSELNYTKQHTTPCVMFGSFDYVANGVSEWQFVRAYTKPEGIRTPVRFKKYLWDPTTTLSDDWAESNTWGVESHSDETSRIYSYGDTGLSSPYHFTRTEIGCGVVVVETQIGVIASSETQFQVAHISNGLYSVDLFLKLVRLEEVNTKWGWVGDPLLEDVGCTLQTFGGGIVSNLENESQSVYTPPGSSFGYTMATWNPAWTEVVSFCLSINDVSTSPNVYFVISNALETLRVKFVYDNGKKIQVYVQDVILVGEYAVDWSLQHTYDVIFKDNNDILVQIDGSTACTTQVSSVSNGEYIQVGCDGTTNSEGITVNLSRITVVPTPPSTVIPGIKTGDSEILWALNEINSIGDILFKIGMDFEVATLHVNGGLVEWENGDFYLNNLFIDSSRVSVGLGSYDTENVLILDVKSLRYLLHPGFDSEESPGKNVLNSFNIQPDPSHLYTKTAHTHPVSDDFLASMSTSMGTWTVLNGRFPIIPVSQSGGVTLEELDLDLDYAFNKTSSKQYLEISANKILIHSFPSSALYLDVDHYHTSDGKLENVLFPASDYFGIISLSVDNPVQTDTYVFPTQGYDSEYMLFNNVGTFNAGAFGPVKNFVKHVLDLLFEDAVTKDISESFVSFVSFRLFSVDESVFNNQPQDGLDNPGGYTEVSPGSLFNTSFRFSSPAAVSETVDLIGYIS